MSSLVPGNQKHLTEKDRHYIEDQLNEGKTFLDIAKCLCKDPTTISKEVKAHRSVDSYHTGSFNNAHNFCVLRYRCKKTNACEKVFVCGVKCASCPTCNQTCKDYVKERCNRLDKAPYVCNGCDKKINHCTIACKYHYSATFAERMYKKKLIESRSGINMTRHEIHQKDMIVSPLIEQGQSPYQIVTNHPELNLSVRSIYSYIDQGIFLARNIDLKRQTKFKPRKCHKTQITDRQVFIGRTYLDFQALAPEEWVEMDTVHSSRDSKKVLLTFFFQREKLFLAFLMNRCTTGAVRLVFDHLENRLGTCDFLLLFPDILTDRGVEFGNADSLENGIHQTKRTSIYFCDPMRSGQKGGVENAHNMLRTILPKGSSFEYLTQWDVNRIVNHMNATPRECLKGRTPYDAAVEAFPDRIISALQLRRIEPDEVNLTPKLIRNTH